MEEKAKTNSYMEKLKIYLAENLSSELMPLVLEKVSVLNNIIENEEWEKLKKVNLEISNFIADNNIKTQADIAREITEKQKENEEQKETLEKESEEFVNGSKQSATEVIKDTLDKVVESDVFQAVKEVITTEERTKTMICSYYYGGEIAETSEYAYDGEMFYFNGTPAVILSAAEVSSNGNENCTKTLAYPNLCVIKFPKEKYQFAIMVLRLDNVYLELIETYKIDFSKKTATAEAMGIEMPGRCY